MHTVDHGHESAAARPLAGVRVISIATNVPGPVAVARMIALGATALKVEPPGGDFLALASPAWYAALNANQATLALDLKDAEGRSELFGRLSAADVFVTSQRPGSLARLGLDVSSLRTRFPSLCTVRIMGHSGDEADRPGHDLTFQALAGLVSPPALPVSLFADIAAGESAATAACALLVQRFRVGHGGVQDVIMEEVANRLAEPRVHGLVSSGGLLGGALPAYGIYAAREGWIAVAALEGAFLERLKRVLGIEQVSDGELARAFATRTAQEWDEWGRANDVPVAIVREY